jgi:hypothetical protein
MLKSLKLKNVGPAPQLGLELASRLNLITGDNGLGKSFLLDVAWWVLTRRWPRELNANLTSGYPARPLDLEQEASIGFDLTTVNEHPIHYESHFNPKEQAWVGKSGRPWNPGLVVYAHADGGFSVWDPARNYWKTKGQMDVQERLPGYVFSPNEVWDGLYSEPLKKNPPVCNGLLVDWADWIRERGRAAELMEKILGHLAPDGEKFEIGPLVRLSIDDARRIPSVHMPYAKDVPILHAAAGIRRVVGLAYMLLWSWTEHEAASRLTGQPATKTVVLLFDELESHLHPRWQRTILSSILEIVKELNVQAEVQLIAATHSPLILASAEPLFNPDKDAWFDIDLENQKVVVRQRPFVSQGMVSNWLTSNAFDLMHARSKEAEEAMEKALAVLREKNPAQEAIEAAATALREARLPDTDPFWVRWLNFVEENAADDAERKAS